jgi:hypothetical protein
MECLPAAIHLSPSAFAVNPQRKDQPIAGETKMKGISATIQSHRV